MWVIFTNVLGYKKPLLIPLLTTNISPNEKRKYFGKHFSWWNLGILWLKNGKNFLNILLKYFYFIRIIKNQYVYEKLTFSFHKQIQILTTWKYSWHFSCWSKMNPYQRGHTWNPYNCSAGNVTRLSTIVEILKILIQNFNK